MGEVGKKSVSDSVIVITIWRWYNQNIHSCLVISKEQVCWSWECNFCFYAYIFSIKYMILRKVMSIMVFSWAQFRLTNFDGKSIQLKFEDLCRQLFINEFLGKNKVKHYLHANPNNAGLETEPIFCEESNKRIGFQAKFFEDRVDYRQIMESVKKIVSNYSGNLDTLFIFCNKDISTKNESFRKI